MTYKNGVCQEGWKPIEDAPIDGSYLWLIDDEQLYPNPWVQKWDVDSKIDEYVTEKPIGHIARRFQIVKDIKQIKEWTREWVDNRVSRIEDKNAMK